MKPEDPEEFPSINEIKPEDWIDATTYGTMPITTAGGSGGAGSITGSAVVNGGASFGTAWGIPGDWAYADRPNIPREEQDRKKRCRLCGIGPFSQAYYTRSTLDESRNRSGLCSECKSELIDRLLEKKLEPLLRDALKEGYPDRTCTECNSNVEHCTCPNREALRNIKKAI